MRVNESSTVPTPSKAEYVHHSLSSHGLLLLVQSAQEFSRHVSDAPELLAAVSACLQVTDPLGTAQLLLASVEMLLTPHLFFGIMSPGSQFYESPFCGSACESIIGVGNVLAKSKVK